MMEQNELNAFMKKHDLAPEAVAKMLNVSVTTVKIWRCKSERNITEKDFSLLKFMVGEKNV